MTQLANCALLGASLCVAVSSQTCVTQVGTTAFGTWTEAGSPYCVTVNVTVGGLTIQPGVVVLIDPGITITVASTLTVLGTAERPVIFTERGAGQGWGGILFSAATASSTMSHCIIERATNSGVRIVNAGPRFTCCVIRRNSAPGAGGGILATVNNANLVFDDCEISENRAANDGGGGMRVTMGAGFQLRMNGCKVASNASNPSDQIGGGGVTNWGGGLHLTGDGALQNCAFLGNRALTRAFGCSVQIGQGGAIFAGAGALTIDNCIIASNLARGSGAGSGCYLGGHGRGGGIAYVASGSTLAMENTIVCGNIVEATYSAGGGPLVESGSGLHVSRGASATLTNCTLTRNKNAAIEQDGTAGSVHLINSIAYFNHSLGTNPPTFGPQFAGTVTATFSNVQNGFTGTGNIDVDPFLLRPDCGLGGPVIHPVSACVDAGDPDPLANDRAFPPSRGGARNDMGAHGGPNADSFTPPCLQAGGAQVYGRVRGGSNRLGLDWSATTPLVGFVRAQRAPALAPGLMLIALDAGEASFGDATLLVGAAGLALLPINFDNGGQSLVPVSLREPALLGIVVYVQALAFAPSGTTASNGLALTFY